MRHIVVVEDDPHNAVLLRKLLEKRGGWRVTVTESVGELLEAARGGADLAILDVSLANTHWQGRPVNGVDLCRMLKGDPRTVGMPVILATAHAMRGDAEHLLAESGADGYVAKPLVDHAAFVDQVRATLEEAA